MSALSLGKLLYSLLAIVVAGLVLLAMQSFYSAGSVTIGSKLYDEVIQSKDVIADVLPPPQYIVEAALLVRQMQTATREELPPLIKRFKETKEEFESGHERWLGSKMPRELYELITQKTAQPAREFYREVEQKFMPALMSGDQDAMHASFDKLDSYYQQNRTAVVVLVAQAEAYKDQLEKESSEKLQNYFYFFSLTAVVIVIVVTALCLGVIREVRQRFQHILAKVEQASQGNLAVSITVNSNDEFAVLAMKLNEMLARFREVIQQLQKSSQVLSTAAVQSSHVCHEGVEDIYRQNNMGRQLDSGMEKMSDAITAILRSSGDTLESVERVRDVTGRSISNMQDYINKVHQIAGNIETAAGKVGQLDQLSNTIGSVLDVIRNIAEQTNLLALNAAIEAARAGEQGRGFAVVADEVRSLASKTGNSTTEIQQMIERLQASTREVVQEMQTSREEVNAGVLAVQVVGDLLRDLSNSVEEIYTMNAGIAKSSEDQKTVTKEFEDHLHTMTSLSGRALEGMQNLRDATDNLSRLAEDQRKISQSFMF